MVSIGIWEYGQLKYDEQFMLLLYFPTINYYKLGVRACIIHDKLVFWLKTQTCLFEGEVGGG